MDIFSIFMLLAIVFGFMMAWGIGANDVSNAMGTSVGSGAINIRQAIIIAAIFEFLGAFLAGGEVTNTIKNSIINVEYFNLESKLFAIGMLSSLLASGSWLLIASIFGWPVSTTHTIIGAIIGFGLYAFGIDAIQWEKIAAILTWWILSPLIGGIIAFLLFMSAQIWIFRKAKPFAAARKFVPIYIFMAAWLITMISFTELHSFGIMLKTSQKVMLSFLCACVITIITKIIINRLKFNPDADLNFHYTNVEKIFSILMIFTACAMAFAHGSNDVANAIGPVAAVVAITNNPSTIASNAHVPIWILLLGASGIVVGLAMYGHKVIATVGTKITQLTPSKGFSATMAAATTVVIASTTGFPISTTHTLVGGVLGVGLARGIAALNMDVIRGILLSWLVTLPVGAILSIVFFWVLQTSFGLQ
jgi:inorganic phosphate transporter, PiT family